VQLSQENPVELLDFNRNQLKGTSGDEESKDEAMDTPSSSGGEDEALSSQSEAPSRLR